MLGPLGEESEPSFIELFYGIKVLRVSSFDF